MFEMAETSSVVWMVRPDTVLILQIELKGKTFLGSHTVNGNEWGQSQTCSGKTTCTGVIKRQERSSYQLNAVAVSL